MVTQDPAPYNYGRELISSLEPEPRTKVKAMFKRHLTKSDYSRAVQTQLLNDAGEAAVKASKEIDELRGFIDRQQAETNTMVAQLAASMKAQGYHVAGAPG